MAAQPRNPLAPTPPGAPHAAPGPADVLSAGPWRPATAVLSALLIPAVGWQVLCALVLLPRLSAQADGARSLAATSVLLQGLALLPFLVVAAGAVLAATGLHARCRGAASLAAVVVLALTVLVQGTVPTLVAALVELLPREGAGPVPGPAPQLGWLGVVLGAALGVLGAVAALVAALLSRGAVAAAPVRRRRPALVAVAVLVAALVLAAIWGLVLRLPPVQELLIGSDAEVLVLRVHLARLLTVGPGDLVHAALLVALAVLAARVPAPGRRPALLAAAVSAAMLVLPYAAALPLIAVVAGAEAPGVDGLRLVAWSGELLLWLVAAAAISLLVRSAVRRSPGMPR